MDLKLDLFEAVGGRSRINAAVDLFYRKVLADPSLRSFFDGTNMNGLQAKQAMFLTMLVGGEQRYGGRDIWEAHVRSRVHGLSDTHFDAFVRHMQAALQEVGVTPDLAAQIAERLETTRAAVLGRKA